MKQQRITYYSEEWPGTQSNYNWSVRYDVTDEIIGISQTHNKPLRKGEAPLERVLLTKRQVEELIKFIENED